MKADDIIDTLDPDKFKCPVTREWYSPDDPFPLIGRNYNEALSNCYVCSVKECPMWQKNLIQSAITSK